MRRRHRRVGPGPREGDLPGAAAHQRGNQLHPRWPGIVRGGHATIDEQGGYILGTYDVGDGAYVGKYKVTIISRGPDLPIPPRKKGKMLEEDMQGSGKPLIPARYSNPMTSGLSAEVVKDKPNEINFDLVKWRDRRRRLPPRSAAIALI